MSKISRSLPYLWIWKTICPPTTSPAPAPAPARSCCVGQRNDRFMASQYHYDGGEREEEREEDQQFWYGGISRETRFAALERKLFPN